MAAWLVLVLICGRVLADPLPGAADPPWRLGFFWSPTADRYPPAVVPWHLYSHVVQLGVMPNARCGLDADWYGVTAVQADLVGTARAHGVKVLITLVQDQTVEAMRLCTAPERIDRFVGEVAGYVREHGYDGLDLDWESEVDPGQYQDLVRRLRAALPGRLLTADIAVHQRGYLVPLQDVLDRINLMNYDLWTSDYHGRQLDETWHHAALFSRGDREQRQTTEAGLAYVLESGIRPGRVNLGVPFYGYLFRGCQAGATSGAVCRQPVTEPRQRIGQGGLERLQVEYREIESTFMAGERRWDEAAGAAYVSHASAWAKGCRVESCARDAFVSYTDPRSMRLAGELARDRRLGGVMTFALHQEYLPDGPGDARYPLSAALTAGLAGTAVAGDRD